MPDPIGVLRRPDKQLGVNPRSHRRDAVTDIKPALTVGGTGTEWVSMHLLASRSKQDERQRRPGGARRPDTL